MRYHELTKGQLKALVNGKFQQRTCTECQGSGKIYSDEEGNVVPPSKSGYSEPCEYCCSLGFHIMFDDENSYPPFVE